MASPFPGMDPYLELPALWRGIHTRLITVLGEMLTREVAPRFFVDSEDTVYIVAPDDPGWQQIRPDIFLAETGAMMVPRRERGRIAAPTVIELPQPVEVRYPLLKVVDPASRRVVAVIELLSPINKVSGSVGRTDFLDKRQQMLQSTTHWIEIDLLRAGARPPGVKEHGDYYALLHRVGSDRLEGWFAPLREELPTIAVPLIDGLPDVPLDLQEAVEIVYDRFRYDSVLDYSVPPPAPPLSAADAAWAAERLRHWHAEREGGRRA